MAADGDELVFRDPNGYEVRSVPPDTRRQVRVSLRVVRVAAVSGIGAAAAVVMAVGVLSLDLAAAEAQEPQTEEREHEARSLFEAGQAAYGSGRFEEALDLWERSYRASPHPELLYNIGQAADRLDREARALEAFEAYLDNLPEAANRASVEARMAILRASIAREQELGSRPRRGAPPSGDEGSGSVFGRWWFWTLVAVVAAGAVVAVIVLRADAPVQEPLDPGGGVARALVAW